MGNLISYKSPKLARYFELSPRGLVVKGTPPVEVWIRAGEALKQAEGATQWWRGDWWAFGEQKYGERAAQAVNESDFNTYMQQGWVSRKIPETFRRLKLSWSHHQAVAALDEEKREYWLDKAEGPPIWSLQTLRSAIRDSKDGAVPGWLKHTDVWNIAAPDGRFGDDYPGRIPGQIVLNFLHYYTEEGDLVVDPMAGGGVTEDACALLGRRCISFDIQPARASIIRADITQPWSLKEKADAVFMDPPYGSQRDDAYGGLAELGNEEFVEEFGVVMGYAKDSLANGGVIGILVAPMAIKTDYADLPMMIVRKAEILGLRLRRRISVPVSSQQVGPQVQADAKKKGYLIALIRDLLILAK